MERVYHCAVRQRDTLTVNFSRGDGTVELLVREDDEHEDGCAVQLTHAGVIDLIRQLRKIDNVMHATTSLSVDGDDFTANL